MDTWPEIIITDHTTASKLLMSTRTRSDHRYVLSIGSPDSRPPAGFRGASIRLRLTFDDIWREEEGHIPPCLDDAMAIVGFAQRLKGRGGKLLIHCRAGISRSTAAAMIVLRTWWGPGSEERAMEHVFAIRAEAAPNPILLSHGDTALLTGGTLLGAVKARRPEWYKDPPSVKVMV